MCKLLIFFEQSLLIGQRIPVENQFAGGLQVLQYARDRFAVQVGALDFQRRIRCDLCCGQDFLLDQPQQGGVTDAAVPGGLGQRQDAAIAGRFIRRINRVFAAYIGNP